MLQRWQRERHAQSIEWLRVLEWTPGSDALGHPHLHVWLFSPFLPQEMLREWWTSSLRQTGLVTPDSGAVIHIEPASEGVEQELIKYLTKDIDAQGNKINAEVYAEVYQALDGRRPLQASRGFMARAKRGPLACECGATLPRRVQRKKASHLDTTDGTTAIEFPTIGEEQ